MGVLQDVFLLAQLWVTAIIMGVMVLGKMCKDMYKLGVRTVFYCKKRERPACLDDPTLGTHGFLHLEDVRIHYVSSGPEDKPLMLFVHGFPEFWFSWRHQIREFQKDYRVVAIDQRGYGESDQPDGIRNYALTKLMGDIKQIIHSLGYKECVLVAHDWGGAVAWAFGRLYPEMVSKMIVMNAPSSPIFQKIIKSNRKQFKMSWYMFFFQLPFFPEFTLSLKDFSLFDSSFGTKANLHTPWTSEEIDAYKYIFQNKGAFTGPLNYYRAAFRAQDLGVKYDLNYSIPILLIWGQKDFALSEEIADLTAKEIPNLKLVKISDAGHFVQMDNPESTNKAMRDWLA